MKGDFLPTAALRRLADQARRRRAATERQGGARAFTCLDHSEAMALRNPAAGETPLSAQEVTHGVYHGIIRKPSWW